MQLVKIIPTLSVAGAEKLVVDLVNSYSNCCNITLIILFRSNDRILIDRVIPDVDIIELGFDVNNKISLMYRLFETLTELKPTLIHTHLSSLIYITPWLLVNRGVKCCHTVHNVAKNEAPFINRKINKFCFKFLGVIPISISNEVTKSIVDEYLISPIQINNGSSPVEPSFEYLSAKKEVDFLLSSVSKLDSHVPKVLCSIARIDPQKNQELLIDLIPQDGSIILLMFGNKPSVESLYSRKVFNAIEKHKYIFYLGVKPNVGDYLLLSDGIVFTSLYEGLPISLIEAMSIGKICISTPAGGIPDVIDCSNGYLSKNFELDSLKYELSKWLNESQQDLNCKRERLISRFNDKYSMSVCAKKHYDLYESLVNNVS